MFSVTIKLPPSHQIESDTPDISHFTERKRNGRVCAITRPKTIDKEEPLVYPLS